MEAVSRHEGDKMVRPGAADALRGTCRPRSRPHGTRAAKGSGRVVHTVVTPPKPNDPTKAGTIDLQPRRNARRHDSLHTGAGPSHYSCAGTNRKPHVRVILFKGRSTYDALRVFVDELHTGFVQAGHEALVVDAAAESDVGPVLLRFAAEGPVGLVFSFNILGDTRDHRGRSLGEMVNAPHVIHFVDYPLTHLERLEAIPASASLLVVDGSHVDAIRSIYGPQRFASVGFCPHGAGGETVSPAGDPAAFASERPIPILFVGTLGRPQPPIWQSRPPRIQAVYNAAVDIALAAEFLPALDALDAAMASFGLDPAAPQFADFRKSATYVHEHVRVQRRFQLLAAAKALGLPLQVYGRGFDQALHFYSGITYGGEVDFSAALALMARSRVVLNVNANFGAGSHERPLCALNAGAAAATDYSSFYAAHFNDGEEIAMYHWRDLETGLARIGQLAEDPAAALAMAQAGQKKVAAAHLWRHRVDAIIAAAEPARG